VYLFARCLLILGFALGMFFYRAQHFPTIIFTVTLLKVTDSTFADDPSVLRVIYRTLSHMHYLMSNVTVSCIYE